MAQSTCWAILALAPNGRFAPGSGLGSLFQHSIGCITFIKPLKKKISGRKIVHLLRTREIYERDTRRGNERGNSCDVVVLLMWCRSWRLTDLKGIAFSRANS